VEIRNRAYRLLLANATKFVIYLLTVKSDGLLTS